MHCTPSCCGGCSSPSARGELPLRVSPLDAAVDVGLLLGVDPPRRDPFRQPVGINLAHPAFLQEVGVVVSAQQRLSHESRACPVSRQANTTDPHSRIIATGSRGVCSPSVSTSMARPARVTLPSSWRTVLGKRSSSSRRQLSASSTVLTVSETTRSAAACVSGAIGSAAWRRAVK